jgi:hypothetical protein
MPKEERLASMSNAFLSSDITHSQQKPLLEKSIPTKIPPWMVNKPYNVLQETRFS